MAKIKICGITNIEDAIVAIEEGADALGFVFAESPRRIEPQYARQIVHALPPFITAVGVFAGQDVQVISQTMRTVGLHLAQIHGKLTNGVDEYEKEIGFWRIIRAVNVRSEEDIRRTVEDAEICDWSAYLLDAHVEGMLGGTGQTFDWDLAVQARAALEAPVILAGGLTPENVGEAVERVQPYAVDVSSGVEASPGRKDHAKIREFIENARYFE